MTRVVYDSELVADYRCPDCGEEVILAITELHGRRGRMKVNPRPHPDGRWVVWHYREEEPVPRHRVMHVQDAGAGYDGPRWVYHGYTCAPAAAADDRQLSLFDRTEVR